MNSIVSANTLFNTESVKAVQQEQDSVALKHKRNLDLALQHAFLIQHQKDIEANILQHIEELTELPQSPTVTSDECTLVIKSLEVFRASDFDDLVAERNSQARCGYILCSNQPRSSTMRTWNLGTGAGDYCSNYCMSKAVYIKVQLSPIPAWERAVTDRVRISLPVEDSERLVIQDIKYNANAELAFERGEKVSSKKPEQVMTSSIVEKSHSSIVQQAPTLDFASQSHAIEGYLPTKDQEEGHDTTTEVLTAQVKSSMKLVNTDDDKATMISVLDEEQQWEDMFEHLRNRT